MSEDEQAPNIDDVVKKELEEWSKTGVSGEGIPNFVPGPTTVMDWGTVKFSDLAEKEFFTTLPETYRNATFNALRYRTIRFLLKVPLQSIHNWQRNHTHGFDVFRMSDEDILRWREAHFSKYTRSLNPELFAVTGQVESKSAAAREDRLTKNDRPGRPSKEPDELDIKIKKVTLREKQLNVLTKSAKLEAIKSGLVPIADVFDLLRAWASPIRAVISNIPTRYSEELANLPVEEVRARLETLVRNILKEITDIKDLNDDIGIVSTDKTVKELEEVKHD